MVETDRYDITSPYLSEKGSKFLLTITVLLFTILSISVKLHVFSKIDSEIFLIFNKYNHTNLYYFFLIFTKFSGELFSLIAFFTMILILVKIKKYSQVFFSFIAFFISAFMGLVLKYAFSIQRPPNHIYGLSGYSFPSGHAVLATTLVLIFYFTLYDTLINYQVKRIVLFLITAYLFLSLFSRVFIGAHWTTDTIGGLLVACSALAASSIIMKSTIHNKTLNFMLKFSSQKAATKGDK